MQFEAKNHPTGLVPISQLEVDPKFNARTKKKSVVELMESMSQHGQLSPVLVTPLPNQKFFLLAGFRRVEAAARLGWKEVSVTVRSAATEAERMEINLTENVQREDLSFFDRADRMAYMVDRLGSDDKQLAVALGVSLHQVRKLLHISRKLIPEVRTRIDNCGLAISMSEAFEVSNVAPSEQMEVWLEIAQSHDPDLLAYNERIKKALELDEAGPDEKPKLRMGRVETSTDRAKNILRVLDDITCFAGDSMPSQCHSQKMAVRLVLQYVIGEFDGKLYYTAADGGGGPASAPGRMSLGLKAR